MAPDSPPMALGWSHGSIASWPPMEFSGSRCSSVCHCQSAIEHAENFENLSFYLYGGPNFMSREPNKVLYFV